MEELEYYSLLIQHMNIYIKHKIPVISHTVPVKDIGHMHSNSVLLNGLHTPAFMQGFSGLHGFSSEGVDWVVGRMVTKIWYKCQYNMLWL